MSRAIVLWDIDQTLVRTGGAGSVAMDMAFQEIYGVEDAFARVEFSGRTDYGIFFDSLDYGGFDKSDFQGQLERFKAVYLRRLDELLPERNGAVLPGVLRVIEALALRQTPQGVATGNFKGGAELKLRHFGLDRWLRGGGYGDSSAVRADLVAEAAASIRAEHGAVDGGVYVIGDTPLDVEAAHANGYVAVAVATGRYSIDELLACGAHHAFQDLTDVEQVLAIFEP
ncbi:MAG: HAD hydrolase-like protein [Dehalococcoidia bacterium]|nr:HAD hydrolase-like protein [Dehalococcoidia bacterium]